MLKYFFETLAKIPSKKNDVNIKVKVERYDENDKYR